MDITDFEVDFDKKELIHFDQLVKIFGLKTKDKRYRPLLRLLDSANIPHIGRKVRSDDIWENWSLLCGKKDGDHESE